MYHRQSAGEPKIRITQQPVPQNQSEFDRMTLAARVALLETNREVYERFSRPQDRYPWER